ncbi:MAG: HD domain-containing protein [Acidobacteriota bacterium]
MDIDRRAFIASLGGASAVALMTSEQKAEALEAYMEEQLDAVAQATQAPKFPTMAEIEAQNRARTGIRRGGGNVFNATGRDGSPRGLLPAMSSTPTLVEFFEKRFAPATHVLQSATRALKTGMTEEVILACLLHDVVHALVKVDHGWWGAQLVEPYVSEKVTYAIRYHQALRFYPDEEFGYEYPESYLRTFGEDYKPEPYLEQTYKMVRKHKWYELPRLVTVNDLYSFDPNSKVSIEPFIDIIGRNFKQPKEGLGFDHSATAHMWRTMAFPDRPL